MSGIVKAADIDHAFDNGEDVSEYFDMEHAVRMEAVRASATSEFQSDRRNNSQDSN